MRVAVLADIHGNLPACEAVLADMEQVAPDYIVAAGDLALRGAHPKETVELLLDKCDVLLMGNTDCYIAGNYLGGAYRDREHWKTALLDWTRSELGPNLVKMLGELPFSKRYSPRPGQDLFICHANPRNLEDSLDPTMDEVALRRYFANLDVAACAFGHLHFPYRRRVGRMVIADVASAGIPRDGDLRPAYGVFTYTPRGWRVQIRRVRYQIRKATQAMSVRKVPGAPLLIHKLVEARYRHHALLQEAARRHSGLPPIHPPGHLRVERRTSAPVRTEPFVPERRAPEGLGIEAEGAPVHALPLGEVDPAHLEEASPHALLGADGVESGPLDMDDEDSAPHGIPLGADQDGSPVADAQHSDTVSEPATGTDKK